MSDPNRPALSRKSRTVIAVIVIVVVAAIVIIHITGVFGTRSH